MASEVEIYNLALGHIGNSATVATINERSNEGNVCRRFYSTARDLVLREYEWPFLRSYVTLSLVAEDPTDEWSYSYKYPANIHSIKRIISGNDPDNASSYIRYMVVHGDSDKEIYTSQSEAEAEVFLEDVDTGRYPIDVVLAISYKLAELITPALTAGDPWKIMERVEFKYKQQLAEAMARSANEERPKITTKSEFERVREE